MVSLRVSNVIFGTITHHKKPICYLLLEDSYLHVFKLKLAILEGKLVIEFHRQQYQRKEINFFTAECLTSSRHGFVPKNTL